MYPSPLRLAVLATSLLLAGSAPAENWPQWRGPNDDGVSTERGLPAHWSETQNIAWKLTLPGKAGSTPVVWGERIFLTSQESGDVVLLCVDTNGKQLWKRTFAKGNRNYMRDEANNSSPSPSTDGKHVYVFAGTGDFACFDIDGNEAWHFNAQERYGPFRMQWGTHTSPLLWGDRLYLQLFHAGADLVIALNKATGEEVWKVHRTSDAEEECRQSYTSPIVWHKGDNAYLITHGCDYTVALRLSDGKELWRVGGLNPRDNRYVYSLRFVASPAVTPDLIVIPSAKNGPVVAVQPTAAGNPKELWRHPHGTPDVPSPLIRDGLVYLCSERGVLQCFDGQTGKEYYRKSLHSARYRSSPVYADGKIYLTSRDGYFTVVKAGKAYEPVAVNTLPDQFAASPVVAHGRIYLRGFETLYAVGKAEPASK